MKDQIASLKTDMEKAISLLEGVRQGLGQISGDSSEILEPPEWERQRLKVWNEVYNAGGVVDRPALHRYAEKHKYDTRGLAGFFKGKGSLVSIGKSEEGKVALSEWATEEVERYREWLDKQK